MTSDTNAELRIATRIHYALLRHLGSGIDVGAMLTSESYAREVLYVCAGSGDEELQSLGRQFELSRAAAAVPTLFEEEEDDGLEPVGSGPADLDALPLPRRDESWLRRAQRWLRKPRR